MKKILLILIACIFVGCTNVQNVTTEDGEYIKNYIKDIDAKIEAEFNTDPRGKYPRMLTAEELKNQPLSFRGYMEVVDENGYKNAYDGFDQHLKQSVSLGQDGKAYGVYKYFDENERLTEIGFIDKGGVFSGTKRIYYPNGKLKKVIPYYKGSIEGERIFYFENGQIEEIYTYVNNKEEGEGRINYENGNPKVIEIYKNGKKEGPYRLYDYNGKLLQKGINKNGKAIPDEEF